VIYIDIFFNIVTYASYHTMANIARIFVEFLTEEP